MAVTARQKNASASSGTLNATCPAWSLSPVAGNLLIVIGHEVVGTNGTWPTTPAGYTAFSPTPFVYNASGPSVYGLFWKIAAGADATPGNYGETSSTQDWVTYTYEFNAPGGWISTPNDAEAHSAASATTAATKASGSTATLAQASELAIVVSGHDVAVTALTYSGGFTVDRPASPNGKLWVGWQEVAATTALSSTASWTTSTANGVRIATFKLAAAAGPLPADPGVYSFHRLGTRFG